MKYYVVYDNRLCFDADFINATNIICYHEDLDVINRYGETVEKTNPGSSQFYEIGRAKIKDLKRIPSYYDFYLVRYGSSYIQAGYMELVEHDLATALKELAFAKEIIFKHLEFTQLSVKDKGVLQKACGILQELELDIAEETPTLDELKIHKMDYEMKERARSAWFDLEDDPTWGVVNDI